jgi:hypothetical protein
MTMIVMLIVLVPLAIPFARAVAHDLQRRRRHALPAEVESRAAARKASIQASYPGAGGGI